MALLGKRNPLRIRRETSSGFYLDGEELGEILLPGRYIPPGSKLGDTIEAFVYRDSEDRLVATTEMPLAMVGEFARLKVIGAARNVGAFLDWGLSKDLLLPLREQAKPVAGGDWVVAYIFIDPKTNRIVATTRLNSHFEKNPPFYKHNHPVQLLVASKTPLGWNVVVEGAYRGLLFSSNLSGPVKIGQKLQGYVRTVREDGKIDVALTPTGYRQKVTPLTDQILERLNAQGGFLGLDDKSSPEMIQKAFSTSKKAFKQALGALYKEKKITFENGGITLLR